MPSHTRSLSQQFDLASGSSSRRWCSTVRNPPCLGKPWDGKQRSVFHWHLLRKGTRKAAQSQSVAKGDIYRPKLYPSSWITFFFFSAEEITLPKAGGVPQPQYFAPKATSSKISILFSSFSWVQEKLPTLHKAIFPSELLPPESGLYCPLCLICKALAQRFSCPIFWLKNF